MHPKIARLDNSIVLPDLVGLMGNRNGVDLYNVDGGGYEMAENEISIDLFCGAGGTSEGIKQALGESPMFALNHNPVAIGVHDANHPETIHLESDVFAMDPAHHVPAGHSIGLLTASPSCVHFSTARGGKPLDREIRDQAWVVCNWAENPNPRFNPRVIVIENVREFLTWAPLNDKNKIDKRFIDKDGLGSIFKEWRSRLIAAGYAFEYKVLNAADYGVATKRRRLLMVARKDGLPIRFPTKTHAPRDSDEVASGTHKAYATAAEHIDFTLKANPIFMYPEDAKKAGCNRPLADNTLKRVAAGVERYVIEASEPYIISYYGAKGDAGQFRGQGLDEPLPTQTTENRFALVSPMISPITHSGPGRYYQMDGQFPTFTCARRGEFAVISPICSSSAAVIPMRRECDPVSMSDPMPAFATRSQMAIAVGGFSAIPKDAIVSFITADPSASRADGFSAAPFFVGAGGGEYAGKPRAANDAINTITCNSRQALVMPSLIRVNHGDVDKTGKRRGQANHDIQEPLPTQPTSNEFAVVSSKLVPDANFAAATMIQIGYGERVGQAPRTMDIREPTGTFVTDSTKHAVIAASLVRTDMHKSNAICAFDAREPVNSMTTTGGFALVEAGLQVTDDVRAAFITNNNTNRLATSADEPIPAMTTGNQQIVTEAGLKAVHIGQSNFDHAGQPADEPLTTMTQTPQQVVVQTGLAGFSTYMVAGHMAQQNTGNVGHPLTEPVSTMTTAVSHQNLVTSHLLTLRQNCFGQSVEEPIPAFCAAGGHHAEVRTCLVKYYGEGGQLQAADEPLDTLTTKARFSVVQVPVADLGLTEEQRYEAWWIARFLEIYGTKPQPDPRMAHLDGPRPSVIGRPGAILWTVEMRMLAPKEAFSASSFPKGYQFEHQANGKAVSKTDQLALVGNAVPPGLAKAIISANVKPRPSVQLRMAA